jgi:hypothetical protein
LAEWSRVLEPLIDRNFAQEVWKDFLGGRTTWSRPWSLYVLNEWVKRNLHVHGAGSTEHRRAAAVSVS